MSISPLANQVRSMCSSMPPRYVDLISTPCHRTVPPNVALGHEGMGRVVAVDEDATDERGEPLTVGDQWFLRCSALVVSATDVVVAST